jgi:hypothetical protein
MTNNHIDLHAPTQAAEARMWPSWRAFRARGLAAAAALLVLLATPGAEAASGRPRLGWSSAPRWRLPRERPPECPQGFAGARRLTQVQKARCIETGAKGQVAKARSSAPRSAEPRLPGVRDDPGPTPRLPGVRDDPGPRARPVPAPAPVARGRRPTIAPGPDATALMAMDRAGCHAHLNAREVPFVDVDRGRAPEVAIPVRLTGAVAGVEFTIPWSDDPDRDPHAVWDCRLVAAIVPVAEFLHAHGVTEVQYFSALRRGKIVRDKPRSQHNVGLALDLLGLRGPGLPLATVEAVYPKRRLRACPTDASAPGPLGAPVAYVRGLFHTILTPDHDRAHYNHLHLDLKAEQPSPADPFLSVDE